MLKPAYQANKVQIRQESTGQLHRVDNVVFIHLACINWWMDKAPSTLLTPADQNRRETQRSEVTANGWPAG